jgi:hypothetical protein
MLDNLRVHIERVIAYWSQLFKGAETRYLATEQEALAAKEGLHQRQEDSFSHRPRRTPVGKDVQKHKQTPRRVGCRIFGVLGPAHRTPARKSSLKRGSLVAASATGASVCRTKVGWVRAHQHVWSARSVDPNWGVRFNNNLSEIAASAKVSTAAVTRLQPPRLKKGVPASRTTFTKESGQIEASPIQSSFGAGDTTATGSCVSRPQDQQYLLTRRSLARARSSSLSSNCARQ